MTGNTRGVHRPDDAHLTVADDDGTIDVQKVVSQGERLEIDSGEDVIKLDSLLLEGLSWQRERGVLQEVIAGIEADDSVPLAGGTADETAPELTVSNEYSHTTVRKVITDGGEALQVETPARGTSINLSAQSLRALATVSDTYIFSRWFKTPFGPEDDPVEGPL